MWPEEETGAEGWLALFNGQETGKRKERQSEPST